MNRVLAGLTIALLGGCGGSSGGSVCSQACEKMQGCGVQRIHITSVNSYGFGSDCADTPCDSVTTCVSRCILDAACTDLATLVPNGKLHQCLIACNSFFRIDDAGAP
jgi:hypothetical protein